MKQLYDIQGLAPQRRMSGAGFQVALFPAWRDAVEQSEIAQENADYLIANCGAAWLEGCGFDWCKESPSSYLRIAWGEWGPEHISVPGNACGLDLDNGICAPHDGMVLLPHNVDHMRQAHLLLVMFLSIANGFVLDGVVQELEE